MLGQRIHRLASCHASSNRLVFGLPLRQIRLPVVRQLTRDERLEFSSFLTRSLSCKPRSASANRLASSRLSRPLCGRSSRHLREERTSLCCPIREPFWRQATRRHRGGFRALRRCPASSGCRSQCASAPESATADAFPPVPASMAFETSSTSLPSSTCTVCHP